MNKLHTFNLPNKSLKKLLIFLIIFACPIFGDEIKQLDLGNGISVVLEEKEFIPADWKIEYYQNTESISYINGKVPFGVDGSIPKRFLYKLQLQINGKIYDLDVSNMYNAWGNRPIKYKNTSFLAANCYSENYCTLRGLFSDGCGAFVAEWVVLLGKPERTILTRSKDIINLFRKDIGPPEGPD